MQSFDSNFRFRGWRESQTLVTLGKGAACDMVDQLRAVIQAEEDTDLFVTQLALLGETHVATLQHWRAQLAYRLKSDS